MLNTGFKGFERIFLIGAREVGITGAHKLIRREKSTMIWVFGYGNYGLQSRSIF